MIARRPRFFFALLCSLGLHWVILQAPFTRQGNDLSVDNKRPVSLSLARISKENRIEKQMEIPIKKQEMPEAPGPIPIKKVIVRESIPIAVADRVETIPVQMVPAPVTLPPSQPVVQTDSVQSRYADSTETAGLALARPLYKSNPPPLYPFIAKKKGYQGVVVLDIMVTADGRATDLHILSTSQHDILDQAALHAVENWRFEPARQGGSPVAMRVKVPVRFELH